MSLGRACLRLCATAALRDATIAGPNVFDSKIGLVEAFAPEQHVPAISVYTEEDSGDPVTGAQGGPPFRPHVELVFEIAMVEAQYDEAAAITNIACPATDPELEAALDVLEAQIKVTLFEDLARRRSVEFRKICLRAMHYQSMRFREESKAERFARRFVILRCEIKDEPVFQAFDPELDGLDLLPPTFRAIAKAWPDDLPEKAVARAMAQAFKQPGVPRGLGVTARVNQRGDAATTLQTNLLRPRA